MAYIPVADNDALWCPECHRRTTRHAPDCTPQTRADRAAARARSGQRCDDALRRADEQIARERDESSS